MTRRPCWISKLQFFSHNLYEKKRDFSAANDHCANYPFCDIGVSLRPSSAGWVVGGEVSPKLVVLLIEEETMLLLEFIYHN